MTQGFVYEIELWLEAIGAMCLLFCPMGIMASAIILSPPFVWWKILGGVIAIVLSSAMIPLGFAMWQLAERMEQRRVKRNPVS